MDVSGYIFVSNELHVLYVNVKFDISVITLFWPRGGHIVPPLSYICLVSRLLLFLGSLFRFRKIWLQKRSLYQFLKIWSGKKVLVSF